MANRGLFGRIVDAFKVQKEVVPPVEKWYNPMVVDALGGLYGKTTIESILRDAYHESDDPLSDPRTKLRQYQLIAEIFPYAGTVIDRKSDLIGSPVIVSEDERFAEEMNAYLRELKSIGEKQNPFAYDTGIDYLIGQLSKQIYRDGSGFLTFQDKDGKPIKINGKIESIKVHDPYALYYHPKDQVNYDLYYKLNGTQEIIGADRMHNFRALQFERTTYLWGKPITAEAEFVLRWWLAAGQGRQNYNTRIGAPLEMTVFGVTTSNIEDPNIYAQKLKEAQAAADAVAVKYREAVANRQVTQRGVDLVGTMPASVNMHTHTYGKDAKTTSDFVAEIDTYTEYIINTLNYPSELLGFSSGGDGLGSQKYEIAANATMKEAASNQRYYDRNLITPLVNQFALTGRVKAPKYEIKWDGGTLSNHEAKANVQKTEAETMKIMLEVIEAANMNLSPDDREIVAGRILEEIRRK